MASRSGGLPLPARLSASAPLGFPSLTPRLLATLAPPWSSGDASPSSAIAWRPGTALDRIAGWFDDCNGNRPHFAFECARPASSDEPSTRRFPVKTGATPPTREGGIRRRPTEREFCSCPLSSRHPSASRTIRVAMRISYYSTATAATARSEGNGRLRRAKRAARCRCCSLTGFGSALRPRLLVGDAVRQGWIGRRAVH